MSFVLKWSSYYIHMTKSVFRISKMTLWVQFGTSLTWIYLMEKEWKEEEHFMHWSLDKARQCGFVVEKHHQRSLFARGMGKKTFNMNKENYQKPFSFFFFFFFFLSHFNLLSFLNYFPFFFFLQGPAKVFIFCFCERYASKGIKILFPLFRFVFS